MYNPKYLYNITIILFNNNINNNIIVNYNPLLTKQKS
jgi:hypothetical protein